MYTVRLYLLRVIFFFLFFPIALCISELSIRFLNLKELGEPRHDVVEVSYMPTKLKANYQGTVMCKPFSTNQYGFPSDSNLRRTPPPGEFRILSLGDSVGIGLGIEPSARYTKVLETNLNKHEASERFRVINAAGQGYSPSSYYVYLKQEGRQFEPHMVIIAIELCNDITDEALLRWETLHDEPGVPQAVRGGRYVVGWDGNLLGTVSFGPYFFEKTYTYTLLLRRVLKLLYRLHPTEPFHSQLDVTYFSRDFEKFLLDEKRLQSGWKRTFGALKETHRFLQRQGIFLLLLILPSRYIFDEDSGQSADFARQILDKAVRLARQEHIPYLDFTHEIATNGGSELYFDFAHLTAEGNRIIGDKLSEYLITKHPTMNPSSP